MILPRTSRASCKAKFVCCMEPPAASQFKRLSGSWTVHAAPCQRNRQGKCRAAKPLGALRKAAPASFCAPSKLPQGPHFVAADFPAAGRFGRTAAAKIGQRSFPLSIPPLRRIFQSGRWAVHSLLKLCKVFCGHALSPADAGRKKAADPPGRPVEQLLSAGRRRFLFLRTIRVFTRFAARRFSKSSDAPFYRSPFLAASTNRKHGAGF